MRKIYLSVASLVAPISLAIGQNFVSTSAENKNVVLEEFTGIHCGFCPDGHVKAQEIKDANQGDVVLINIHTGSYADPNPGEPDFRTTYGDSIGSQSDVSGYPAGTVNRHDFSSDGWDQNGGTAMSRGYWDNAADDILTHSSYVNVAAESTIDFNTRELTVIVEVYYTADGPSMNLLNVALMQNNVEGPQSGATTWNPGNILPNGNYNHQHMLRDMLTGQWGDTLTTTTSGTYYTDTITYAIPASITSIDCELVDMEVAVFINESEQEIITGNLSAMDYILPPGISMADLEATTGMALPANFCETSVTPEITVTNNAATAVDTFSVSYTLNGGTAVTVDVFTGIGVGEDTTIVFPAITLNTGENSLSYEVNFGSGVTVIDNVAYNNYSTSGSFYTLPSAAFATSHVEDFESYSSGSDNLDNAIVANVNGVNTYVVDNGVSSSVTWNIGAFGNSDNAYRFRFYSGWSVGDKAAIIFENIDLSASTNNVIKFSHAYAQYAAGDNDQLEILVSLDCGATWTSVFTNSGDNMATVSPYNGGHYYPQTTDWINTYVDISAYDGESAVMLKFEGTSDDGNNLYIDDIMIDVDLASSVTEMEIVQLTEIYPNPTTGVINIDVEMMADGDVTVKLFNITGKQIDMLSNNSLVEGFSTIQYDLTKFPKGIYMIEVNSENSRKVSKVIKN